MTPYRNPSRVARRSAVASAARDGVQHTSHPDQHAANMSPKKLWIGVPPSVLSGRLGEESASAGMRERSGRSDGAEADASPWHPDARCSTSAGTVSVTGSTSDHLEGSGLAEVPEGKFASVAKRGGVRLPPRVDERDARDGDSSLIVREETRGRCAGGDGVESGVGGAAKRGRGGLYERSKSPRLVQRRAQTFRRGNRRGTVRGGGRVRGVVFLLVLGGEGFAREGRARRGPW